MANIGMPRYGYVMFFGAAMQGPFTLEQIALAERALTSWQCANLSCRLQWFNEPLEPKSVRWLIG